MRLAVFTNQFPARVSTFFARDMRGLVDAGIELDIFPFYPLDDRLWKYVPKELGETVLPRNRVHHISLRKSLTSLRPWPTQTASSCLRDACAIAGSAAGYGATPIAKSMYVLPKAWAWAKQYANTFDHILAYWGSYAGTCAYAFHRLGSPSIPFSLFLHAGADLYRTPIFLREKMQYARQIITCSNFNRQYILVNFGDVAAAKTHVSYHGLDFDQLPFSPGPKNNNQIVAVGGLEPYKGFDYLLRAIEIVARRRSDIKLQIVGDGSQLKSLKALANKLRIEDRVEFAGRLTFTDVVESMRQATVLVHPSPYLGDGLPNVIKESMALGTPVIASDIAAIPEGLDHGKCGVLVPPKDVESLANAIERLLASESLRQDLAAAARVFAEETFDLTRNGERLAALLQTRGRQAPSKEATSVGTVIG